MPSKPVLTLAIASVCLFQSCLPGADCDPAIDTIVMRNVLARVEQLDEMQPLFEGYDSGWKERIARQRTEIAKIRKWALTLKDPCVRTSYLEWLDYLSGNTQRLEVELRTKAELRSQEKYEKKMAETDRRARDYKKPVPEPPK